MSVKANKLSEVKVALGNHPFEELGVVTNGSVEVDGMEWGTIETWKELYDTAIERHLQK